MAPGPRAGPPPDPVELLLERYSSGSPPKSSAGAAATIVLRPGGHGIETLLIERTVRPDDRASGQVGLPGGHVDEEDRGLSDTALRELHEEVGLPPTSVDLPLRFVGIHEASAFSLHVGIFASRLRPGGPLPRPASESEVAHVFWFPLTGLSENVRVAVQTTRGTREVDANIHDGHILWGFTRKVLRDFFDLPASDPSRH
ncbi:MAG: NUDIX hydrolase [Candidatus Lutacidiplasmatales archaeon]